jgi:hypothetical protein
MIELEGTMTTAEPKQGWLSRTPTFAFLLICLVAAPFGAAFGFFLIVVFAAVSGIATETTLVLVALCTSLLCAVGTVVLLRRARKPRPARLAGQTIFPEALNDSISPPPVRKTRWRTKSSTRIISARRLCVSLLPSRASGRSTPRIHTCITMRWNSLTVRSCC